MVGSESIGGVPGAERVERQLLPELLLQLFRRRHTGWVTLSSGQLPQVRLAFSGGVPGRVQLPQTAEVYSQLLADLLPADQLEFAQQHARTRALDPVSAALSLALLSSEQEQRLSQLLLEKALLSFAAAPDGVLVDDGGKTGGSTDELAPTRRAPLGRWAGGSTPPAFASASSPDSPPEVGSSGAVVSRAAGSSAAPATGSSATGAGRVEREGASSGGASSGSASSSGSWLVGVDLGQTAGFLATMARLIAAQEDLDFYRKRLKSTWVEALVVQGPEGLHRHLEGRVRRILVTLGRMPQSPATLLERGEATESELIGIVYTLRTVGVLRSRRPGDESGRPREQVASDRSEGETSGARKTLPAAPRGTSKVPGGARLHQPVSNFPESHPQNSGTRQTARAEGLPERPSTRSPAMAPSKEHVIETSALEAWTRSVDSPELGPKALAYAEKAAAQFPNNPRILFYLGCLCVQQGRDARAQASLQRVLELDPDHAQAQRELALLRARRASQSGPFPRVMPPGLDKKVR